ncbi:MAG: cobalt-precorrin 5A hydrolase [Roseburia sp.]
MKIAIISFTGRGLELSLKIKELWKELHEITLFSKWSAAREKSDFCEKSTSGEKNWKEISYVEEGLEQWTKDQWKEKDALLFVGACGIAVRAIAPFVEDKLKDPAVLVADELGQFVIPILSGHIGGGNELAEELAGTIEAIPVITTATDLHGLFAVDVFAKKHNLGIANREGIAKVSGALLKGENVSVLVSPLEGERAILQLCPKQYIVGIGCKRGKSQQEIEELVLEELKAAGVRKEAVAALASIKKKAEEPGILAFAEKYSFPFLTFSAEELEQVEGEFTSSEFVKKQVGVDNVCERAALFAAGKLGSGEVALVRKKRAENGVTVALAKFHLS